MRMRLMIEGGILLKPYTLAWRPGGYKRPPGWTPDERNEWVQRRTAELMDDYMRKATSGGNTVADSVIASARFMFVRQAAEDHGHHLKELRKPWPGWTPVVYQLDRDIGQAYQRMFVTLNPDYFKLPPELRVKVQWPPDGLYEYDGREMKPVTEERENED